MQTTTEIRERGNYMKKWGLYNSITIVDDIRMSLSLFLGGVVFHDVFEENVLFFVLSIIAFNFFATYIIKCEKRRGPYPMGINFMFIIVLMVMAYRLHI